jgi:hypothetical protein
MRVKSDQQIRNDREQDEDMSRYLAVSPALSFVLCRAFLFASGRSISFEYKMAGHVMDV